MKIRRYALPVLLPLLAIPAAAQQAPLRIEGKVFVLEMRGLAAIEPLNRMHAFDIRLMRKDGSATGEAVISLQGARKFAPNELPTAPAVVRTGEGLYHVEGLRFHMAGEWTLVFNVANRGDAEPLTLGVVVK